MVVFTGSGTVNGSLTCNNAAGFTSDNSISGLCSQNSPLVTLKAGTGQSSFTTNCLIVGNGNSALINLGPGTDGQLAIGSTSTTVAMSSITSSDGSFTITNSSQAINLNMTQATTSQKGGSTLCTGAEAVTGTDASKLLTPSTLTSRLAAPGAIGGTTPAIGQFTTITLTSTSGPTITTGSGAPAGSAPLGSIYFRTDGSATNNRAYINTNSSTTWTALITVG